MQGHHPFDDGLDEVDVAVAASVPCAVDAIGKDADKLGGVAHGFHAYVVVLELAVLHPVGILVVAVAEDKQWTVVAEVFGHDDVIGTDGAVDGDVVGLGGRHSCHKQEEGNDELFHDGS